MECNLDDSAVVVKLIIGMTVDGIGILLTLASFLFLILNRDIDISLRSILISFQFGNLIGSAIVVSETVSLACNTEPPHFISVSVLLSLTHLLLLLLVEHVILTSSMWRPLERFTGLICVCWLLSISLGVLNTVTITGEYQNIGKIVFSLSVIALQVMVIAIYLFLIRKNYWVRKRLMHIRKRQVNRHHYKDISFKRTWKLKYLTFIFNSNIMCGLPWIIQKLYEGCSHLQSSPYAQFAILLAFACKFYFPPLVCVRVWQKRMSKKKDVVTTNSHLNAALQVGKMA